MAEVSSFASYLSRLKAGDSQAAQAFFDDYGPQLARMVRVQLGDQRLRCTIDSMDICQSVYGHFFLRLMADQLALESPAQLMGLLVRMAQYKVISHARAARASKRDVARLELGGDEGLARVAESKPTPSSVVSLNNLLAEVRSRLSPEEKAIFDLRRQGLDWVEIGQKLNKQADAVRKRLTRSLDKIAGELGLEDS